MRWIIGTSVVALSLGCGGEPSAFDDGMAELGDSDESTDGTDTGDETDDSTTDVETDGTESGDSTDESDTGDETDSTDETGEPDVVEFQYPVGDGTTYPAGGWNVWQVMGHYWQAYGGRHLAQDIASANGGVASIDAPVYAVADGLVRYAGPNGSSYRNVVLIEHDLGDEGSICSFFGHVTTPLVETGEMVVRGDQVTSVLDWALAVDGGASSNTHLHYVLLSKDLCDASAAANGALICGYDNGGPNAVQTLDDEPFSYTAVDDICGDHAYPDAFISPTQFIEMHKP